MVGAYRPADHYKPLIEIGKAADCTGISAEDIARAITLGELKTAFGGYFRIIDLAAWVEEQRYWCLTDLDPGWKSNLYTQGYTTTDYWLPDAYYNNLWETYQEAEADVERKVYRRVTKQNTLDGDIVIWRHMRLFNHEKVDEVLYNWDALHEICREVFKGTQYFFDNCAFIVKRPRTIQITSHPDIITVIRDSLQYPAILISVDLTDASLADGGVWYYSKSHRIQPNGRMAEIPSNYMGFENPVLIPGQVKIHNGGIIHGTKVNTTDQTRATFYVTVVEKGSGSVRNEKYDYDNSKYVFEA